MLNKKRKMRVSPGTLILGILAAVLLTVGTIGGARAALTIFSNDYDSHIEMYEIGITLRESNEKDGANSVARTSRDYAVGHETEAQNWHETHGEILQDLLAKHGDSSLILGKEYNEYLTVENSGEIDEYVRVTVYRYWQNPDGTKNTELDPNLIELHFVEGNGWTIDHTMDAKSEDESVERTVLYYSKILGGSKSEGNYEKISTPFTDKLKIGYPLAARVTQTTSEDGKTVTTTFDYDQVNFVVEVQADGVQTHNPVDAIRSAWGRDVKLNGKEISLK